MLVLMARKGGVGKSTLACLLARIYADNGLRVILADLDPQGTSTEVLAPDAGVDVAELGERLTAGQPLGSLVCETVVEGLRIVPTAEGLTVYETQLAGHPMGVAKVRKALESLKECDCDLVVVDTPPTIGAFTFGALAAGTWAVIPTLCEHPSVRTLPSAFRTVAEAQTMNQDLRVLAVVANRLDRATRHGLSALRTLQEAFPEHLAKASIPRAVAITDAMQPGCPLNPDAPVMTAVTALAEELLERMRTVGVVQGEEAAATGEDMVVGGRLR